jgi:hypothetical protein
VSWAVGHDPSWGRDIGYGVPSECDHPECHLQIDRGLSRVCGGDPYGGEHGCGLFFCDFHLFHVHGKRGPLCPRCCEKEEPFAPKPDLPDWILHKLTCVSWSSNRGGLVAPVATPELARFARAMIAELVTEGDGHDRDQAQALDAWLRGEL